MHKRPWYLLPESMERSPSGAPGFTALLVFVAAMDVVTRLAAPVALLAWTGGASGPALLVALVAGAIGVVRGILAGHAAQGMERQLWRRLVRAIRATDIVTLKSRSSEEQAWRIVDTAHRIVELRAQVMPRLVADGVSLALIAVAVVYLLGALWLLLGAVSMCMIALVVVPGQRFIRNAELKAWSHLTELGADLDVLLEGASEIRVHGREAALVNALLGHADRSSGMRRRSQVASALVGLVPLAVIVLGLAASSWADPEVGGLVLPSASRVGVLGGSAFVYGFSLARGAEAFAHAAPQRRLLARYLDGDMRLMSPQLTSSPRTIELDGVTVTYPTADHATPGPITYKWEPGQGLGLVGPNGAGKTTLALCLLGLVRPTEGTIRFDGETASSEILAAFRAGAVYLPQAPYLAPDRSVRWHLRLVAPEEVSDAELLHALREVELLETLESRAAKPLDVLAGSLSGGERRRLFLARLFVPRELAPTLVVLDEPEAGLDEEAREWLRSRVSGLANVGRVLVVVHDAAVVPGDFDFIELSQRRG